MLQLLTIWATGVLLLLTPLLVGCAEHAPLVPSAPTPHLAVQAAVHAVVELENQTEDPAQDAQERTAWEAIDDLLAAPATLLKAGLAGPAALGLVPGRYGAGEAGGFPPTGVYDLEWRATPGVLTHLLCGDHVSRTGRVGLLTVWAVWAGGTAESHEVHAHAAGHAADECLLPCGKDGVRVGAREEGDTAYEYGSKHPAQSSCLSTGHGRDDPSALRSALDIPGERDHDFQPASRRNSSSVMPTIGLHARACGPVTAAGLVVEGC